MVLYGFNKVKAADLLSAIGLPDGAGRYENADNTDKLDHANYYYTSDTLNKAMADSLNANSTTVKDALEKLGYTCQYFAFSDSNDLATVVTKAASESDVIYVPTDNTAAANTEIINNICQPAGVPIIAGEEGIAKGCGVATLSISYYDLGVATGKMAVRILTGEGNISEMPIEYAPQFTKKYNKALCEALGVTVPADYVAIEE